MLEVEMADSDNDKLPHYPATHKPQLRPVEVHPHPDEEGKMVLLRDPSALSDVTLSMSLPALHILSLMDGHHTTEQIRQKFEQQFGQPLPAETIQQLLRSLEEGRFLEGAAFEEFYEQLVREYLESPSRTMNPVGGLGLDEDDVAGGLDEMFNWGKDGRPKTELVGLIAPHLDYSRGRPCYLEAYSALVGQDHIERFVILGTNHFGRSSAIVATGKDFQTPLGVSAVDFGFLAELERRCGQTLRRFEFDHQREHSVELQVLLLQHLFGADSFRIVPFICPSPAGPQETAPSDEVGVDLKDFARSLSALISEDDTPTCVIAGADLSHVGRFFGDTGGLSDQFLGEVRDRDQAALARVEAGDPEGFLRQVHDEENPTRICSAGCIYTLMVALSDARPRVLRYHQAVNQEMDCTVTCAAATFEAR